MMKGQKGYVLVERSSWQSRAGDALRAFGKRVGRWYELHRQRRLLARLSDEALSDLGLSRADIMGEAERPFWDDPLKR